MQRKQIAECVQTHYLQLLRLLFPASALGVLHVADGAVVRAEQRRSFLVVE
jgi:hypothetical protein